MLRLPLIPRMVALATFASTCVVATAAAGHASPTTTQAHQPAGSKPGATAACAPETLIKKETVEPDPSVNDPTGVHAATVYEYGDPAAPTKVIIPPTGWDPNTASLRELHFYGFDSRPTNAADLQTWDNQLVANPNKEHNLSRPALDGPLCTTSARDGVTHTQPPMAVSPLTATSSNWAGIVAHGDYHYVHGEMDVPPVDTGCSGGQYTNWVGIDGYNNSDLEQAGIYDDEVAPYLFYEAIGGSIDTHVTKVPHHIELGQRVAASTSYFPGAPKMGEQPSVTFGYRVVGQDSTAFFVQSPYVFHAGVSAEAIDERPTVGGSYSELGYYDVDSWNNTTVTSASGGDYAIRSASHDGVNMVQQSTDILLADAYGGTTDSSFGTQWDDCGKRGN